MSDLVIYGQPLSTYVRTATMACEEKFCPYTLEAVDIGSEDYRAIHPFGKMPAMRHGALVLYETSAIVHYIDDAFDGHPLAPEEPGERARMEQWISVTIDYLYDAMIRRNVLQYVFPSGPGGKPDTAMIEGAQADITYQLGILDRALDGRQWLAGGMLTLADLFVVPILSYVRVVPGGREHFAKARNVGTWLERIGERHSYQATLPPPPGG